MPGDWILFVGPAVFVVLWIGRAFARPWIARQFRAGTLPVARARAAFYAVSLAPHAAFGLLVLVTAGFPLGLIIAVAFVAWGIPWAGIGWAAASRIPVPREQGPRRPAAR